MSQLSRKQMEEIIKGGGSVMVGSEIVTDIKGLPSEVQLAKGNAAATQSVRESLEATKRDAERQLAELDKGSGSPESTDTGTGGEPTVIDLETLTVEKLKELAEEQKIPLAPGLKKAEIIEAIRAAKPEE